MKILVTDKLADEAIQLLKNNGFEVKFEELDHDGIMKEITDYDVESRLVLEDEFEEYLSRFYGVFVD